MNLTDLSLAVLDKFRAASYLHRDISLGNVMLLQFREKAPSLDRYITKIADLEYARSYERLSQLEPIVVRASVPTIGVYADPPFPGNESLHGRRIAGAETSMGQQLGRRYADAALLRAQPSARRRVSHLDGHLLRSPPL